MKIFWFFIVFASPLLAQDISNTYSTDSVPKINNSKNTLVQDHIQLFQAVQKNDRFKVSALLNEKVDPNIRDEYYRTPLMYADNKSLDVVELLLARGAYINTRDSGGNTILMIASEKGYTDLVRLLLNYSVLINAENRMGVTALHLAIQNGHTDIVISLTDHSANIHQAYPKGLPPIFEAVKKGYTAIASHLISRGVNPNSVVPSTGTSLLSIASAFGYVSTVQQLLNLGADPNLANKLGITPIFLSVGKRHDDVTKILLKHGASTKIKTKDNVSLSDIVFPGDSGMQKLLQKHKK
ncbi:MAG: ankyrin repeat domain-containing protein [Brevinema sp.]